MKIFHRLLSLHGLYELKMEIFKLLKLDRIVRILRSAGITPNQLTVINFFFGLNALFCLFSDQKLFVFFLIINIIIDTIDGFYARTEGLETKMGTFLDHGSDFTLGILILAKSYLVMNLNLSLVIILFSFFELMVIYRFNLWKSKFPTRIFLLFYLFGFFRTGLLFQIVYQPLSLALVCTTKKSLRRHNSGL